MRRFHFSLEPVLRLRQRLEEQALVELALRQRQLEREQAELEKSVRVHQAFETDRAALQRQPVEISVLVDADRYGQALARAVSQQQERARSAAIAVEEGLQALQQRRIERETIDRLRERRWREHREQELRDEQQALDEISVLRWRRE